jgi:hypothetical protein
MELGSPTGTGETVGATTRDVTVQPVEFAQGGGCPTAPSFTVLGSTYSVSYSPLCDALGNLKYLFLAMAALLAGYILADSFRV